LRTKTCPRWSGLCSAWPSSSPASSWARTWSDAEVPRSWLGIDAPKHGFAERHALPRGMRRRSQLRVHRLRLDLRLEVIRVRSTLSRTGPTPTSIVHSRSDELRTRPPEGAPLTGRSCRRWRPPCNRGCTWDRRTCPCARSRRRGRSCCRRTPRGRGAAGRSCRCRNSSCTRRTRSCRSSCCTSACHNGRRSGSSCSPAAAPTSRHTPRPNRASRCRSRPRTMSSRCQSSRPRTSAYRTAPSCPGRIGTMNALSQQLLVNRVYVTHLLGSSSGPDKRRRGSPTRPDERSRGSRRPLLPSRTCSQPRSRGCTGSRPT